MSITRPVPRYRCHKEVSALKIAHVIPNPRGVELHFVDERFAPHQVDASWAAKHKPAPLGYWVCYDDGYQSYSPAAAFEAGYTPIQPEPENGCEPRVVHNEERLEALFWEFDAGHKRHGDQRREFKGWMRVYAQEVFASRIAQAASSDPDAVRRVLASLDALDAQRLADTAPAPIKPDDSHIGGVLGDPHEMLTFEPTHAPE